MGLSSGDRLCLGQTERADGCGGTRGGTDRRSPSKFGPANVVLCFEDSSSAAARLLRPTDCRRKPEAASAGFPEVAVLESPIRHGQRPA